ncbi:Acg family FMN-binding oxidoreductase [Paractinoplanes rishiriensis]|uniref:NAD(P)H nitroreductase n=1 Tax=Paractinoplanes rishiriensis TaxID=1050105 RepID=A0A919K678_9ACTN|nr:nitroreductase [Actinoplanes rishiriensis]GIF00859.1 putative NAD(P)H nitroreductase [Actinoplanes rishiriensis]
MNPTISRTDREPLSDVLIDAATAAARYAPSVLNTQPWRWRVHPDRLELFAERSRQLNAIDSDGRLLTLSCGAVLHHARIALAAQGWTAAVFRTPGTSTSGLLAVLHDFDDAAITPKTQQLAHAMRTRHTDRRPLSEQPLAPAVVRAIAACADSDVRVHVLTAGQVLDLSAAASRAGAVLAADPPASAELEYWTSRTMGDGVGLALQLLPERAAQTTVPNRGFGHPGTLPIGGGHDRAATYVLLYGDEDDPHRWLKAGETLSAVWLAATALNVSVLPLSDVVTVPATREALRRMLTALDHPYLTLRLGIADPPSGPPRRTPRLPAAQLVEAVPPAPDTAPPPHDHQPPPQVGDVMPNASTTRPGRLDPGHRAM